MEKLHFQQPLLQSSVSHDPSEINLICSFSTQETVLLVIDCGACFLEPVVLFFLGLISKHQHLFDIESLVTV